MDSRSDGADRNCQGFGNLGVGEPLPCVQEQGLDFLDRLPIQYRSNERHVALRIECGRCLEPDLVLTERLTCEPPVVSKSLSSGTPQCLTDEIVGDAEKPGSGVVVLTVEARAVLKSPSEDVAGDVFSPHGVETSEAETSDYIEMTIEDGAEGFRRSQRLLD